MMTCDSCYIDSAIDSSSSDMSSIQRRQENLHKNLIFSIPRGFSYTSRKCSGASIFPILRLVRVSVLKMSFILDYDVSKQEQRICV